jgi:hypothetical protein
MSPNPDFSLRRQHSSLAILTPVLLATFFLPAVFARDCIVSDAPPSSYLLRRKPILMSGLLQFARNGDLASVQRLLASGVASITERDGIGLTALLRGAYYGRLVLVQWLLSAGGASITERDCMGWSALLCAAYEGHLELVQWLLSAGGASITERSNEGCSALLLAASRGHFAAAQWLLEEGGASIHEANKAGDTVWSVLKLEGTGADALASLLKVMVLLADAPPDFVTNLSPAHAELATRGRQLRAQLPSYLEQQRGLVVAHCPLPAALQPIVSGFAVPTAEDMWTDGLRVRAPRPKRPRAGDVDEDAGSVPLRRSVRLRQKRE